MTQTRNSQFNLSDFRQQFSGSTLPPGDLVGTIGNYFLGVPYIPATLEAGGKEKLIVNFAQFDCFTFVETVLALTRCVLANDLSLKRFREQLQFIRYRKGLIDCYYSRLHYFTDWLHDNKKKGIVKDISRQIGAKQQYKVINFMTTNRNSYPALQDENAFQEIRKIEKIISRRKIYVLPRAECSLAQENIKTGDIIAFASLTEGLDVAHVGFALWRQKKLHLLHASSKANGVVVSAKPLIDYLRQNKNYTGIIVARVKDDVSVTSMSNLSCQTNN